MKLLKNLIGSVILVLFLISCKSSQVSDMRSTGPSISASPYDSIGSKESPNYTIRPYRAEDPRHFKLIHTKLDLKVDWENEEIHGLAEIFLRPYFYPQSELKLDAKSLQLHSVALVNESILNELSYTYDGRVITIDLEREYTKDEEIQIAVKYTTSGVENREGENVPYNKKGFYFINPREEQPGRPRQLWTLGETESNSRWFPTIDAPNQKMTQEVFITVENKYTTLSNGKLIYSRSNPDSTRTDYWKMSLPHAPYLCMIAAGDFEVYEDHLDGLRVDYYMEPEYAPYAKNVFGNTPEMISFFSKLLNVPFPWEKYSQIVVRDFASGAMENTTASVFMEGLNVDSRDLVDENWDDIIAHELVHQWFGNYVTCESWANLPLNESFATYFELLWKDYKYGADEAAMKRLEDLTTYLDESETKNEHLIRFDYDEDDEMFDSHSYAKGGLILHMLRNYLGDEAFFQSLEYYLKKHAFGKAEAHELRLAFEHIAGEDLNWFFNQWFFAAGHPKLKVEEQWNQEEQKITLKVSQEQNTDQFPVYKLHLIVDVWQDSDKVSYVIEIDKPYQEFDFECNVRPDLILVDSDFILVGELEHEKSPEMLTAQYHRYHDNVRARQLVLDYFAQHPQHLMGDDLLSYFLQDSFWGIRQESLGFFDDDTTNLFTGLEANIITMATSDPHSLVRADALGILATREDVEKYQDVFRVSLNDSSYSVVGYALYGLLQTEPEDVAEIANSFIDSKNFSITSSLADYFISNEVPDKSAWFKDKLSRYSGSELWYFTRFYAIYLMFQEDELVADGVSYLEKIAHNHHQFYIRVAAYQSLQLLVDFDGVQAILEDLRAHEKDERAKVYFTD